MILFASIFKLFGVENLKYRILAIKDSKEIKLAIKNWPGDYLRV